MVDLRIATSPRKLDMSSVRPRIPHSPQNIGGTRLRLVVSGWMSAACAMAYAHPHCVPRTTTSHGDVQRQNQRRSWLRLGCTAEAQRLRREGCGVTSGVAQSHGRCLCSCLGDQTSLGLTSVSAVRSNPNSEDCVCLGDFQPPRGSTVRTLHQSWTCSGQPDRSTKACAARLFEQGPTNEYVWRNPSRQDCIESGPQQLDARSMAIEFPIDPLAGQTRKQ